MSAEKINKELLNLLACPMCKASLELEKNSLKCPKCNKNYAIKSGIPILLLENQ
ncbi:MAG: Trm112 family protein [Candidatus Nanoarchaeia archaeon]|jgi:hypothetical protein